MRDKQKKNKTLETMTLAERGEYIQQAQESVRQYGNKELLLLFCLMRETGIRMGDILELRPENVQGRELQVIERKYGGTDYYRNLDGSLPVISETAVALLVPGEDGRLFHHEKRYYVALLRKAFADKEFRFHYLRRYVLDMMRMQMLM